MQKESGFTLVEILVVIGIMAIVAAIAIPNYMSYRPKMQVKSVAREIVSDTQRAKVQAIRSQNAWGIKFDAAGKKYEIYDLGTDSAWNGVADSLQRTFDFSDKNNVQMVVNSGANVIFYNNGTTNQFDVSISNTDGGNLMRVRTLSAAGAVSIN